MRQKPSKQKKGKTQNAMNTSVFRYIFCLLIFPLVNFLFIIIALFASFVHNSSFLVVDIAALILFNYFSAAYVLVPFSLFFRLEIERIRNSFPLNFFFVLFIWFISWIFHCLTDENKHRIGLLPRDAKHWGTLWKRIQQRPKKDRRWPSSVVSLADLDSQGRTKIFFKMLVLRA